MGTMHGAPSLVVFLPATVPGDPRYGAPPDQLDAWPEARVRQVHFPRQVWYNAAVRREAEAQIRALGAGPVVLIGFSKSGLGAWNLARAMPDRVAATILFDAPVARPALPPWDTASFYADDAAWQKDLPLRTVSAFAEALPVSHLLVLISGAAFHDEMVALDAALAGTRATRLFLPRPALPHHWRSGWIAEGVQAVLDRRSRNAGT